MTQAGSSTACCSEVVCLDGEERREFTGQLTVGRHPLNDLSLPLPRISSRHAVIEWDGEHWRVRDLGSRNGVSVNGRRILAPKRLKVGDVLRFAGTSAWRVQRLSVPVDISGLGASETVSAKSGAPPVELFLTFDSPAEGTIRVKTGIGDWHVRTSQRFILLYLLAQVSGEWLPDDELKQGLWGKTGAERVDPSALHKLIHDTRRMFQAKGVDGWFIQKERGRTRLALPPTSVHVDDRTSR